MSRFLITLLVGVSLSVVILLLEQVAANATTAATVQPAQDAQVSELAFAQLLAQQIAELEIQKLLLQALYTDTHPALIEVQDQQTDLRRLFDSLPVQNRAELLQQVITRSIESKLTELETAQAQNSGLFTEAHPLQQLMAQRIQNLQHALTTWCDRSLT